MIRGNKKYLSWESCMRNLMLPYADGFLGPTTTQYGGYVT